MDTSLEGLLGFVEQYGILVVFLTLLLDQLGAPIPATPLLLGFGALAGAGRLDPVTALLAGVAAAVLADVVWYGLGRSQGSRLLALLCKVSLEPDTCVQDMRELFQRHGVKSLLVAKFIPGLGTVAAPLAGMSEIGPAHFLAWSAAGSLLWVGSLAGLGFAGSKQIEGLMASSVSVGGGLGALGGGLLLVYLGVKFARRQAVLRELHEARITPEELHGLIQGGEQPVVVDVRHRLALDLFPHAIPGSLFLTFEEIELRHGEIPREREVVLYCA